MPKNRVFGRSGGVFKGVFKGVHFQNEKCDCIKYLKLVEAGMGCAVCLDGALSIHADPNLCFRKILPEHTTRSVILWKKNHLFSQAASLFVQTIQEY